jgi:hypothetical protein
MTSLIFSCARLLINEETLTENKEETVEVTALEAKLNLAEKFLA